MSKRQFKIDGKECSAEAGQFVIDAAAENGVYIPSLCHMKGVCAAGSCRICTVKFNGANVAACTAILPETGDVNIESNTPELTAMRKMIVELLFVEGNHFCPSCEKSGNCELQALAYRFQMLVPEFSYNFPLRNVDATSPKIYLDRNRCIQCKRCIRTIKDDKGRSCFAFYKRGHKLQINIDHEIAGKMNDEQALKAMQACPVGAIIKKEIGFAIPIGKRKFDKVAIGSDIEKK